MISPTKRTLVRRHIPFDKIDDEEVIRRAKERDPVNANIASEYRYVVRAGLRALRRKKQ